MVESQIDDHNLLKSIERLFLRSDCSSSTKANNPENGIQRIGTDLKILDFLEQSSQTI